MLCDMFKRRCGGAAPLLAAAALGATVPAARAQEEPATYHMSLPAITVWAPRISLPAETDTDLRTAPPRVPFADGGAYLRTAPGVTAGRFGGHGLEPFIRGQSQNQLAITTDGATTYGACPNRMDPPASYVAVESFDRVEIVRGYQSVLNGPGGSGGTIRFRTEPPGFGPELDATGHVAAGYEANSSTRFANGQAAAGTDAGYLRGTAAYKDAGNYRDGDGDKVRSSFEERAAGATLGLTPGDATHLSLGYSFHTVDDALFPGAGMDSPKAKTQGVTGRFEHEPGGGAIERIEATAYASFVDHVMDNYSLRPRLTPPFLRVDSTSDTFGGTLRTGLAVAGQTVETAIDYRRNERDATRFSGPNAGNVTVVQSVMWPGIDIDEIGLAAEAAFEPAQGLRLVTGLRYDLVRVTYGRANQRAAATGRTANDLYRAFYGVTAADTTEHNAGGLVRAEIAAGDGMMAFAGVSRSVRTADTTERGLAGDMGGLGAMSRAWVGKPDIAPEKHHQAEAGLSVSRETWAVDATSYLNLVDDYILRDSARAQTGILIFAPDADVYRNIDALLAGVELRGEWQMRPSLALRADATYTYGKDRDGDRPLPQIPPLQGALHLDWQALQMVSVGGTLRYAARQTRVDTDPRTGTGRDVRKTAGYAVLDLRASVSPISDLELTAGVTNLFDVTYANHLNRSNVFDPVEVQVNEPGRAFYLQGRIAF